MTTPDIRTTIKSIIGTITVDGVARAHEHRTGKRPTAYEVANTIIDMECGGELDVSYERGYRNVEESAS